jgi:hypothetical protein
MSDTNLRKAVSWMDAATRIIVFMIPVLAYVWTTEFNRKFSEFNSELHEKFVTQRDAEVRLVSRAVFDEVIFRSEGKAALHEANSNIHLGRDVVVTKDLYQVNRLSDKDQISSLKQDTNEIKKTLAATSIKLDRLLEMVLTREDTH